MSDDKINNYRDFLRAIADGPVWFAEPKATEHAWLGVEVDDAGCLWLLKRSCTTHYDVGLYTFWQDNHALRGGLTRKKPIAPMATCTFASSGGARQLIVCTRNGSYVGHVEHITDRGCDVWYARTSPYVSRCSWASKQAALNWIEEQTT